jgi:L-asparaginase II
LAGYADGFGDGRAEGLQEGRALAVTAASPPGTRDRVKAAFDAGYRAGADSAFGGYDGGWSLGEPYVIVLAKGGNGITYRIAARILARDGVDYHRCPPPTSICQQPRG